MFAPFLVEGVGLHTGRPCRAVVEMGLPGTGVSFLVGDEAILARADFLAEDQERATALAGARGRIGTVEHLMAALAASGEVDVRVAVEGPEIPILDGSARPFVEALTDRGAEAEPRFVALSGEVAVRLGSASGQLTPIGPGEEPSITVLVDFDRPELPPSEITFWPWRGDFASEIAPARTFVFESDIAALRTAGLGQGGSLDCALVIAPDGPINPEGMRFFDEPARHKLLDAVGDLFLLGGLPHAAVRLSRPGHRLLHALVKKAAPWCTPIR